MHQASQYVFYGFRLPGELSMRSDSATAVETAVIPVISPATVAPDAEAWQAVVRHLIVFRPVRGRGHPRPGEERHQAERHRAADTGLLTRLP